jgi:hypothetical protein
MTLRDRVNEAFRDYDVGDYTLGDTQWRLVYLVDEPEQVDTLLSYLPPDFAESWLLWVQELREAEVANYFHWDGRPMTAEETRSFEAVRAWLRHRPQRSDRK